jgi:O-antigen ligase
VLGSLLTPEIEGRLRGAGLACACLFVVALPFDHTAALRVIMLGLAAGLTFASGGWRELATLPLRHAWLAWAGIAALSVFLARNPIDAFGEFRNEVAYTFVAYATWYTLARDRAGAVWLTRALVAAIATALALGVVVFAPGRPWFDLGAYGDVGSLTTFLVTVLPVLLLLALLSPRHSALRIGAFTLAAGCFGAGFLALNRIFWFAAATEIIVFSLLTVRNWKGRQRRAVMVGGVALVAGVALTQVLLASQSRIAISAPGTDIVEFLVDDPRGDLWRFALGQIAEHPWIGAGVGKWAMRSEFGAQFHDPLWTHAHNVFLNRALETGLPGLAIYLLLLASLSVAFWRLAWHDNGWNAALGAAGLALVAGVVVKNLTDDFLVRQNALLFWSLAGAALGAAAQRPSRRPAPAL